MQSNEKKRDTFESGLMGVLKDKRLKKKGQEIVNSMIEKNTVILNRLAKNRSELVSYCRFFKNDSVKVTDIVKSASEVVKTNIAGKELLVINDTSEINFNKHKGFLSENDPDLGPLGNDKDIGFFIHPSLVVDAQNGFPLGFSDIIYWNRFKDKKSKIERNYKQIPIDQKESIKWINAASKSKEVLSEAKMITIVADRESDIYEEFAIIPDEKTHLLIRCCKNRKIFGTNEYLYDFLKKQKIHGTYTIEVKGDKRRKRAKRTSELEIRFTEVEIRQPKIIVNKSLPQSVTITVVEVKEKNSSTPANEDPILWRLLTTYKVSNVEDALRIVHMYQQRWLIEEFFRTLKSEGLDIESSEIESGERLKKLTILSSCVALKVLQLKQERNGKFGVSAEPYFTTDEIIFSEELIKKYEGKTEKQKNQYPKNSLARMSWIIGRIGGWKGYKSESPPGTITLIRGLNIFNNMYIGWSIWKIKDVCIE